MFKVILNNVIERSVFNVNTGRLTPSKEEEYVKRLMKEYKIKADITIGQSDGTPPSTYQTTGGYGTLKIDADTTVLNEEQYMQVFTKDGKVVASIDKSYIVGIIEE